MDFRKSFFSVLTVVIVSVSACLVNAKSIFDAGVIDFSRLHLIAGCRIHTIDGVYVREFAGIVCLFMGDGRYISANAERIAMFASDKSEVWRIPGHYHHQLNWSADKKSILALSSEFVSIDGATARVDVLRRIDLKGRIIAEISSRQIFDQLKIERIRTPFTWDQGAHTKADFEISHFNSFYEVPRLTGKSKHPAIKSGNFIANSTHSGAVILDPSLKQALAKFEFPTSNVQTIHDVQVTSDGRIIFLNNDRIRDMATTGPRSSIEILDPVARVSNYTFSASPPEMFYTPFSGGVQQIDSNHVLISHVTNAFFFLNMKSGKIIRSDVLKDEKGVANLASVQQIRAEDIRDFLKKW